MKIKINKAYGILGLIKKFFQRFVCTFIHLYKAVARSHLVYANVVWSPHHHIYIYIEEVEKVQMRVTKIVKDINECSYENQLRQVDLPT
jgi:hypothetical protein